MSLPVSRRTGKRKGKEPIVMLNANEVVDAIHGSYHTGSKRGLENTRRLMARLCPEQRVPIVHVAGTNGKGSTCAMLESILRHAGMRTGLYTSPFLQAYPERIRFGGVPMTDELLVKYGNPLIEAARTLEAEEDVHATPFELGTALALSAFEGEQVDIAIVEVGLGGRLDPTNIVSPVLCGITAIGLDHMQFLGGTPEAIAAEKAGIIKHGVPVVCHPAEKTVAAVFAAAAASAEAPLRQLDWNMLTGRCCTPHGSAASYHLTKEWKEIRLSLPGEYQLTNAMLVLAMVEELCGQGFIIPESAVRRGLMEAVWPARMEWCGNVLIDGAHNAQGVAALLAFADRYLPPREKRVLLTGVLSEKLQPEMLASLCRLGRMAFTVTPDNPRAMAAAEYAAQLTDAGLPAQAFEDLGEALAEARAAAGENGVVIASGSLYFAGMMRNALGLRWR